MLAHGSDVSRAYFHAPSLKPTFVEICPEDFEPRDEHRCGELNVSMYGTRPAAGNWQRFCKQKLEESRFSTQRGKCQSLGTVMTL